MKKVNIKIKGGKISADFTGFQGNACEVLDRRIRPEDIEVEEQELKPEYHFSTGQTQQETEKNGW